eukprot:c18753_g1_i1 orf=532-816(-)
MSDEGMLREGAPSTGAVWASCAVGQLVGAGVLYSRGHGAASMPIRAFYIASLLISSGACATAAAFHAAGIHQIEDLKELGKSVRHSLDASLGKS